MKSEASPVFDYFDSGGRFRLGDDPGAIERLEKTLATLWSRAQASDDQCRSVYRLALANLVVIGSVSDARALDDFASRFAGDHPSRVLLAFADPNAESISATLTASCRKNPSGEGVICWEKITLHYPSGHERPMASALRALLVGRIATIVVLAQPIPDARAVDTLTRWADLLVTAGDDLGIARSLLYWDRTGHRESYLRWIDRGWMSLLPWRKQLAAECDAPDVRDRFLRATRLTVRAPSPHTRDLIAGWIISRFGWPIIARSKNGVARVLVGGDREAGIVLSTGDTPAIDVTSEDGTTSTFPSEHVSGSHATVLGWDNEALPDRILDGLHGVASERVFLTAADAALQLHEDVSVWTRDHRVWIADDPIAAARAAARRIATLITETTASGGRFRIALAGGNTPKALYEVLAQPPFRESIPWDRIDWFWGDERWVPQDHADSNYRMARETLLDSVSISRKSVYPIPTVGDLTPSEAAEAYEATLRDVFCVTGAVVPRFDLILLGLGHDGHTASLFPSVALDPTDQALVWGGDVMEQNGPRVTLTPRTINTAANVIFLVTGAEKADILAETLQPSWDERYPAARIELCYGQVEWFVDRAAAGKLRRPTQSAS